MKNRVLDTHYIGAYKKSLFHTSRHNLHVSEFLNSSQPLGIKTNKFSSLKLAHLIHVKL